MIDVGQAIGYLDLDTSRFKSGFKSAMNDLKTFRDDAAKTKDRLSGLSSAMTFTGSTLTKSLSIPILAMGAGAITAGIQFESAFAGVRKTVDATEEQLSELRQGILDLSEKMPQSASDIAKVAEAAGQLGIKTESILSFTKTMVMLGDATNLSSEQAATSLARFANITKMSQDKFDRLGSTIVALGNNMATTEAEIVDMGLNIAAAGSQVGLTEAQIMAAAGALSSLGLEAAGGGTAFSRILKEMQLAAETGGLALDNFAAVANMSSKEFAKAFKENAAGAVQAFLVGLTDTERMGSSTIKMLNDLGIVEVRTSDTLTRMANANKLVASSFDLANKAWSDNTALSREAEQRYATTASQLKILWNQIKNIGIEIADNLLPILKDLLSWIKDLVSKFSELSDEQKKSIVTMGLMVAAIGPLLLFFGKGIATFIQITTAIKGCTWAMMALKSLVALFSGPVGWVTLAVAALTIGIVAWIKHTNEQTEAQKKLTKQMEDSKKAYDEVVVATDKQAVSLEDNTEKALDLIDKMYKLSDQEMDTAMKVSILNTMNEELQKLIPDVNIEIDNMTGKIRTEKVAVQELVLGYIKLQAAMIYDQKRQAEAKRYTEAIMNQQEAIKNETEARKKLNAAEQATIDLRKNTPGGAGLLSIWASEGEQNKARKELNSYSDAIKTNGAIMEDAKKNIAGYEEEQKNLEKAIIENLGIQVEANKDIVNSDTSKVKAAGVNVIKTKEQLEAEEKAKEKAAKAAEQAAKREEKAAKDSFNAEKDRFEKLTDLNKTYTKDIEDIQKVHQEKLEEIKKDETDRVKELTKAYEDSVEERAKSIRGSISLFEEFDSETELSSQGILKNLKSQLKGIQEWRKDLQSLSERGVTGDLLEELQELGPSAAGEIDKLNRMTNKQLQEYIKTWDEIAQETKGQAELESTSDKLQLDIDIDKVKDESKTKIDELNEETKLKLDELITTYQDKLVELGVKVSPSAKESGVQIIKAIEIGVDETEESLLLKLNSLKDEVQEIVKSIQSSVAEAEKASSDVSGSDGSHASGLDYVPFDGYRATLHKGERVLTAQEAKALNGKTVSKGQNLNITFKGSLSQFVRNLKPEFDLEDVRGGEAY